MPCSEHTASALEHQSLVEGEILSVRPLCAVTRHLSPKRTQATLRVQGCGRSSRTLLLPCSQKLSLTRPRGAHWCQVRGRHTGVCTQELTETLFRFTDHRLPSEERAPQLYGAVHALDQPAGA